MRQALLDRGCSGAHIAADVTEADVYWYCEDWCGLEDLERQLKTERFVRLLGLLEIGPRAPLLEFRVIAETRGLDYVATVRGNFAAEHRSRR